jgi:hypothetical protein
MAWIMPIADAGSGIFWFVVILFVIISKIVQATKKNAAPPAGGPKPRTPASSGESSPEDELRDFLKRLSQDADQPPPIAPARPAAPPPPPAGGKYRQTAGQVEVLSPKLDSHSPLQQINSASMYVPFMVVLALTVRLVRFTELSELSKLGLLSLTQRVF